MAHCLSFFDVAIGALFITAALLNGTRLLQARTIPSNNDGDHNDAGTRTENDSPCPCVRLCLLFSLFDLSTMRTFGLCAMLSTSTAQD